jgi:hypothetical protein
LLATERTESTEIDHKVSVPFVSFLAIFPCRNRLIE